MTTTTHVPPLPPMMAGHAAHALLRTFVIGLMAFLTVVDLFATQAILPSLARHYQREPGCDGVRGQLEHDRAWRSPDWRWRSSAGASTAGAASRWRSRCSPSRPRPLAVAPDLTTFTALRIAQGLCMSSAFALTLSYLGEQCSAEDAAGAFAGYITGNVASNLIGRLMSAALVDTVGLAGNFYVFAALNLAGAVLVWFYLGRTMPAAAAPAPARRSRSGRSTFATVRCGRASRSGSASCSRSSAPSPT